MKTLLQTSLIVGVLSLGMQVAAAEGDAEAGRIKAETCLGCHSLENAENTYPMYRVPKVGGQNAPYIVSALKAYQSGDRSHKTMQANAAGLNEQDIEDIAAFFAGAKQ